MPTPWNDTLRAGAYWTRRLSADQLDGVAQVVANATDVDGVAPLSEHVLLRVRKPDALDALHLLLRTPTGGLAGYAQLDLTDVNAPRAEVLVDPAYRRMGYGAALLRLLRERAPDGRLQVWAHGRHPGAEQLARSSGFRRTRVLWLVQRSLIEPVPPPTWPAGIRTRTFEPGRDEEAWLLVNARAFAHHPDQGNWTLEDLELREAESWFDPAGFFVAERLPQAATATTEPLAGFHWTKIHPANDAAAVGEVYVIGVDPAEQGTGLGRALLLLGMQHLRDRGLTQVILYVDEDNVAAMTLYERMGFERVLADVTFETP